MEQTRISSVQASAIREVRERWDGAVDALAMKMAVLSPSSGTERHHKGDFSADSRPTNTYES